MIVGNLVSPGKINNSDNFKVVDSIDNIDKNIPTLIIGYDYVNKIFPEFDISSNKIQDNIYWTFKRTEKRDKFEEDLDWFKSFAYHEMVSNIRYIYVDFIHLSTSMLWKIIRKIKSLDNIISFYHENMVYIYGENKIFGIDLKLLKFLSINIDKVLSKIKTHSSVFLAGDRVLNEYINKVGILGEQIRYLPFIHHIDKK